MGTIIKTRKKLAVLILASALKMAQASATTCEFVPNLDYGRGSRESSPARSKEECCKLCQARSGCASGTYTRGVCWFKTLSHLKRSNKAPGAISCVVPGAKAKLDSIREIHLEQPFNPTDVLSAARKAVDASSEHTNYTEPRCRQTTPIVSQHYLMIQQHTGFNNQMSSIAHGYLEACKLGMAAFSVAWVYADMGIDRPQLDVSAFIDLEASGRALSATFPECAATMFLPRSCALGKTSANVTCNRKQLPFGHKDEASAVALTKFVFYQPHLSGWGPRAITNLPFGIGATLPHFTLETYDAVHFNLGVDWLIYKVHGLNYLKSFFHGDRTSRILTEAECCSRKNIIGQPKIAEIVESATQAMIRAVRKHLSTKIPILLITPLGKDPDFNSTLWMLEDLVSALSDYTFVIGQATSVHTQINAAAEMAAACRARKFISFPESMLSWNVASRIAWAGRSSYGIKVHSYKCCKRIGVNCLPT